MGQVYAEIELVNNIDLEMARRHLLDKDDIRSIKVRAMVDTGAVTVAINENIQEYLQLPVVGSRTYTMANGQLVTCNMVGPLDIRLLGRDCTCRAVVLPGDSEPLLGVIPLEDMDLVIHPLREEITTNPEHPDFPIWKLKRIAGTIR